MSMSDPIADLLTRIRNAGMAKQATADVPASRTKEEICQVLKAEGYIEGYDLLEDGPQGTLRVSLRYTREKQPVIKTIRRVSKPSLRVYNKSQELRPVRSGLGISIVSTSQGIMTGKQARNANIGGEVMAEIW